MGFCLMNDNQDCCQNRYPLFTAGHYSGPCLSWCPADLVFGSILYISVNNFAIMLERLLGSTSSTKLRLKYLHNMVPLVRLEPVTLQSQVKHSIIHKNSPDVDLYA